MMPETDKKPFDGLLMLNGEPPSGAAFHQLDLLCSQKPRPLLLAADGGANHLAALGIRPDLIIGDRDSLSAANQDYFRAETQITLPRNKDFTDGAAALETAWEKGLRRLAIFGAFGGEADHFFANLLLPAQAKFAALDCHFFAENCHAFLCRGQALIRGEAGDLVSLLPLSAEIRGLSLHGFAYPLEAATTTLGDSLCLRNQLTAAVGEVCFEPGLMLIFHFCRKRKTFVAT